MDLSIFRSKAINLVIPSTKEGGIITSGIIAECKVIQVTNRAVNLSALNEDNHRAFFPLSALYSIDQANRTIAIKEWFVNKMTNEQKNVVHYSGEPFF